MAWERALLAAMTDSQTVRPYPSFSVKLPERIIDQSDSTVSSFWLDGADLLLQLSSYIRTTTEGTPLSASDRLAQRLSKHAETWVFWEQKICPENSADQATAEFLDKNGVLWIHCYFVWTHLTIYATISGPPIEVRNPINWAKEALRSIKLTIN